MQRDGFVCVATKSVEPDVCHYWPFTINDTTTHRYNLRDVLLENIVMLKEDMKKSLATLFAPQNDELGASDEFGVSDKAWNMVSLNTQLHRYWGKAYFGLKWFDVVDHPEPKGKPTGEQDEYASFRVE
ncbi:HNH endonuclease [Candidatus Bathyarchaeota archaeon]|nr:HNH endonuclease [Candidatus Bathyarchaeota archaeon]